MKFSAVIRWMLLIGLGATVVAGGAGVHYWNQRHQLVEDQLLQRFAEFAPQLRLTLGQTQVNGVDGITLSQVELRDRATDKPLLRAGTVDVKIDGRLLLDHQQVVVRQVLVDGAEISVIREQDGSWNWQQYQCRLPEGNQSPPPHIDLRNSRVLLTLRHGHDIPPAHLVLTSPQLQAVPASADRVDLRGSVQLAGTGNMQLAGQCNLANGTWHLDGELLDLTADQKLLQLAQDTTPQVRDQLSRLDQAIEKALPATQESQTASSSSALLIGNNTSRAPRFQGQLDISFHVGRSLPGTTPSLKLLVRIRNGRISIPRTPIQLTDVQAEFLTDGKQVRLTIDRSRYREATLAGQFHMATGPQAAAPRGQLQLTGFPVNDDLRSLCPAKVQVLLDRFQPDLKVSGRGQFLRLPDGRWQLQNAEASVDEGRLVHHRFQYPLTGIQASLKQRPLYETGGQVVVDLVSARGMAGQYPWSASGWWKNPGPATESDITLTVNEFPLDHHFRNALDPVARRVIESIDLSGVARGTLQFYREPGLDKKTHTTIDAHITQGHVKFEKFPWGVEQLQGHVFFDSRTYHWKFDQLLGQHGVATVRGAGQFAGRPKPGILDLTIQATGVPLNSELYNALPSSQQRIWTLMDINGLADVTTEIHWTAVPGQKPVIRFPSSHPVRIYGADIRPRPFPYEMHVEEALLSFNSNDPRHAGSQYCRIHSFRARHGDAPITASGFALAKDNGAWRVHLDDLNADRLPPDDDLRSALPDQWNEILTQLHRRGKISVRNSDLDFRGIVNTDADVTAAWDMTLFLHDCEFTAGLDVEDVSGEVTALGSWDGLHIRNRGTINLQTARVLDMPLNSLQGPYTIDDAKLVLGNEQVLRSRDLSKIDRTHRVKATSYGGTVFFDALVDSRPGRGYTLFAEVENASLRDWARDQLEDSQQLEGNVSAWLALQGEGRDAADVRGRGQLEISPAALYEVPVVVELLSALSRLNFAVRKRAAFDYALMSFGVSERRFHFRQVDLAGESLALRGTGSVGFGGDVELDFYSRPPKPRGLQIPVVSQLLNSPTQWAAVRIRGTTDNPQSFIEPTAQLNESLLGLLNAFNPRPNMAPGLRLPTEFPLLGNPMTLAPLPLTR